MSLVPNYNNPFDDYKRQQEEMMERVRIQIEKLNQESIFEEGESPMDYAKRIEDNLKETILLLQKLSNSSREQVEYIQSISQSALQQANSAKVVAEKAQIEIDKANDNSFRAKIKANRTFWLSLATFIFSIFINIDKIVKIAKMIISYLNEL